MEVCYIIFRHANLARGLALESGPGSHHDKKKNKKHPLQNFLFAWRLAKAGDGSVNTIDYSYVTFVGISFC